MTITLINYANRGYEMSRKEQKETALSIAGIDNVIEYSDKDIYDLTTEHPQHFSNLRGAGYWLWKPYLILKTLETLNDGDILVYCDAGSYFKDSILPYTNKMKDIMLFIPENDWLEYQYTKGDIFVRLNVEKDMDITHTRQLEAGFLLLKKSDTSYKFIKEWLDIAKDYQLISDERSINPNLPGFIENRHDQSILSVLGKKHKKDYNIDIESKPFIVHHKMRR